MNLTILFLAFALGQPPQAPFADLPEPSKENPVVFPASVEATPGRMIKIDGKSLGPVTVAYYPGIRDSADVYCFDKTIIFVAAREGVYWVGASTAVDGKASLPVWVMIKVGIPPPPVPPVPPAPPVPPVPPPSPAPIPVDGLRVLIVYDVAKLSTMTKEQQGVLFSTKVRNYLNSKTAVGPDNKTHEWRMWPSNVDATYETPMWKTAFARPRTQLPWITISNGKTGYEGPLPGTIDEALALIQRYEK